MRYDKEHKARMRERILAEAAKALRAEGAERIGVAAVMKRAGLTHGGFYAHFDSREAMIAEAVERLFGGPYSRLTSAIEGVPPDAALARYIDFYLSPGHRDARDRGCPLPSLSGEIARMPDAARERFAAGAEGLRAALAGLLAASGRADAESLAASVMAELVGAMAIARAVPDRARSDTLLAASRAGLKARLGLD